MKKQEKHLTPDPLMTRKEKLFFLRHVRLNSYDFIIDFNCENGRLMYEIDRRLRKRSKTEIMGIQQKSERYEYAYKHTVWSFNNIADLPYDRMLDKKILLIIPNIMHDLSPLTKLKLRFFAEYYATTIVVRDTCFKYNKYSYKRAKKATTDFVTNHLNLLNVNETRIFRDVYRPTKNNGASVLKLYEFFLKYTFKENWPAERERNYFSENVQKLIAHLTTHNFRLTYKKYYVEEIKYKSVLAAFNFKMTLPTHCKFILKRKRDKFKQLNDPMMPDMELAEEVEHNSYVPEDNENEEIQTN